MSQAPVFWLARWIVIASLLFASTIAPAQTRNRIVQTIEDSGSVVVSGPLPLIRPELDRGRVEGSMKIDRAAIVFKLSSVQQAALDTLLAEQQDPHSSLYHRWITPEQYAMRFGLSESDLAKVASWLTSQGMSVGGFSRARTRIFFSATAAQIETAFHTELHQYLVDGEIRFANATDPSVPAALSGIVLGFRGLDNLRPRPTARTGKPNFTSHVTGNHFVAPSDFATIYNLKPLYAAGFDGTGGKIAVVGQSEIHTADIDAFRSAAGLSSKNLQLVPVPGGGSGFSSDDEVEADLDVEWSGGVAKNAGILFVYVGATSAKSVFDSFEYAIDQNLAPVISMSFGNCEANLAGLTLTLQQDVQQANTQGQTVMASSGDSGAAGCDLSSSASATHGLAVDLPASVPEVTAIGGSEFDGDVAGTLSGVPPNTSASATTFWSGTSSTSDTLSSALSYIPEMGWNDTTALIAAGQGLSAGGGGVSTVFAKPAWQTSLTPNDSHRDVPDVSLTASPAHDPSLICSQAFFGTTPTSCTSGFQASDGSLAAVGGTSASAPAFAGIVAILNQATQSGGLGNINSALYSLATSTPSAFHDITTGNNIVPCTAGSTGCPSSHSIGFTADAGYDLVTGLGSVNANVLVTSWPGFAATPDFSLGATSVAISSPGQSGTSTITVTATNGFTGTVDLTCGTSSLPAGTSCTFVPSSVTAASGPGIATLTIHTSPTTPAGIYSVIVNGTSGLINHSTLVTLTLNSSSGTPDFGISTTPPSPATIPAGGSATATVTITAANGFTGNVALVCSVTGVGNPAPTCSLNPGSVANGFGTSILTLGTNPGTPNGNYDVSITGTSGSLTHTSLIILTVQAPQTPSTAPDYQVSASPLLPPAVLAGGSATSTITVTSINGFNGSVNLACSVSGAGTPAPTCSFSSSTVAGGAGTAALTVSTTAGHASLPSASRAVIYAIWLPLGGVALLGAGPTSRRRKILVLLLGCLMVLGLVFLVACGGGKSSSGGSSGGGVQAGTPAGAYTVTVSATSGALAHTTSVTLIL